MDRVIDHFEIPEELAKELSELLIKESIRERLLIELLENPAQYEIAEQKLLPIKAKLEAIKVKITKEYVPEKYNDARYNWNYLGWEVAKNQIEILDSIE